MFSGSADGRGAVAALEAFERGIVADVKKLASATGRVARADARSHAPVAPKAHRKGFAPGVYRDSIVSEDHEGVTLVYAKLPPAIPQNLDAWLEFGTRTMPAHPHMIPAAERARATFTAGCADILQRNADSSLKG